jgi:hypothetical protein
MHPCLEHEKKFPKDLMCCNPKNCLCSDCPFSKEYLQQNYFKKYPDVIK